MKKFFLFVFFLPSLSLFSQTEFSQDNATAILRHLAIEIGPRPMGSPAEHQALQFAVDKFREYGCDTSYIMPMRRTSKVNTTSGIAVGIKHGATHRIILIGGHMDSAGPEIPGADDDGSGSSTVIEACRVLGRRTTQSTVVFCCFGGEEQGLEGSNYFVDHFPEINSVVLMLQVDMANGLGIIELDPDVGGGISAPAWLTRATAEEFSKLPYDHLRYPTHFFSINYASEAGAESDHESFLRAGIPAIDFSTDVTKPIHTPRDNFENFDLRGMKRSGDLIIKLFERFDGGVPSRETERYWLYLLGNTPIIIPIWGVRLFFITALLLGLLAIIVTRQRQPLVPESERIRWSGLKGFLFCLMIVACGWLSSDVLGLFLGLRHPWYAEYHLYYILGFLAAMIGVWFALRLSRTFRFAHTSFSFTVRAVVMLSLFLILYGFASIKLTIEPAVALLLVSLAILARHPVLKLLFLCISPWWMLRLIFSEWDGLLFRSIGASLPATLLTTALSNGTMILLLTMCLLPFLYATVAVLRDAPNLKPIIAVMRSKAFFFAVGVLFIGYAGYLFTIPSYNELWYRDVRIAEEFDMTSHSTSVGLKSSEFFSGLILTHSGKDTAISGRTTTATLQPVGDFDTSWVTIERKDSLVQPNDSSTTHCVQLTLHATRRPYTIALTYSRSDKVVPGFDTPYSFHSTKSGETKIEWYSFPDTLLQIPVEFTVPAGDSVKETIELTFADLAYPLDCRQEQSYFIPRTRYTESWVYKK